MTDRTVLVTGGSRGIGAAVVQRFVAEGWRTFFTYASNADAARKVNDDTGAVGISSDVGNEDEIVSLMSRLDGDGVYLDALVNNAGITGPKRRLDEVTSDIIADVMRVNVVGTLLMCREAVRRMSTTG